MATPITASSTYATGSLQYHSSAVTALPNMVMYYSNGSHGNYYLQEEL